MKADLAQGDKSAFVMMSAELQILSLVILEIVIMVVKLVILFDISKLAANGMGEVVGIVEVFA